MIRPNPLRSLILAAMCLWFAGCGVGEQRPVQPPPATQPATQPATKPAAGMQAYIAPGGYYAIKYPLAWHVTQGQGSADFSDGTSLVRIYAIGLRSAGGKYRNAEHALDDCVFQVRDELKGAVGPKHDIAWTAGTTPIRARRVVGTLGGADPRDVCFIIVPHPTPGHIVSIQLAAPPGKFAEANAVLSRMLETLEFRPTR